MDFNSMSLPELEQLKKDVNHAINEYSKRRRSDAIAAATAAAKEHGFSLNDLLNGRVPTHGTDLSKTKPPKYRSREDPDMTWSGFGRRPFWINNFVEDGGDIAALEI